MREILTNNERRFLEYLYQNGVSTTSELCTGTKLSKTSVLYIAKSLISKNLIQKELRENAFVYKTTSPKQIIDLIEQEELALLNQRNVLESLSQKLQKIKDYESTQIVYYYTTLADVRRIRTTLLDSYLKGMIKRTFIQESNLDIFEGSKFLFAFSLNDNIGIRIEPKSDLPKLLNILKLLIQHESTFS